MRRSCISGGILRSRHSGDVLSCASRMSVGRRFYREYIVKGALISHIDKRNKQ